MSRRIILLVTSPRLPAGLLTAEAWDLVRAHPVLAGQESEQTEALRAAGADVSVGPPDVDDILAREETLVWLAGPTGDQDLARALGRKLLLDPAGATLELCYGSWDPPGARLLDAVAVTDTLRVKDLWLRSFSMLEPDRRQAHATLAEYMLEEAREAYDAILAGDMAAVRDELGDVLLQVLLHARLAEELPESDRFTIDDVAGDFVDKMVRRNPHVFAGVKVTSIEDILNNWHLIKQAEKDARGDQGRRG
jgi:XTP/dITP diphosphohydrolase